MRVLDDRNFLSHLIGCKRPPVVVYCRLNEKFVVSLATRSCFTQNNGVAPEPNFIFFHFFSLDFKYVFSIRIAEDSRQARSTLLLVQKRQIRRLAKGTRNT